MHMNPLRLPQYPFFLFPHVYLRLVLQSRRRIIFGELLRSMTKQSSQHYSINEQRGINVWLYFPQPTCNRVPTLTKIYLLAPFLLPCPCPPVYHRIVVVCSRHSQNIRGLC